MHLSLNTSPPSYPAYSVSSTNSPPSFPLSLQLDEAFLHGKHAQNGNIVSFITATPVLHEGKQIIEPGAKVLGEITEKKEKKRLGRRGKLIIQLKSIMTKNGMLPINATLPLYGNDHRLRTGLITGLTTAFVLGPFGLLFLLLRGGDAKAVKGAPFSVTAIPSDLKRLKQLLTDQTPAPKVETNPLPAYTPMPSATEISLAKTEKEAIEPPAYTPPAPITAASNAATIKK